MAQFSIRAGVTGDCVAAALPPDYHDLARMAVRPDGLYTIVLFAHDRRAVVLSGVVRRAFRRLAGRGVSNVLAVGANFTQEALVVLREHGAQPIALGEFDWTDASYQEVRQL